jgi:hypothetical protein
METLSIAVFEFVEFGLAGLVGGEQRLVNLLQRAQRSQRYTRLPSLLMHGAQRNQAQHLPRLRTARALAGSVTTAHI